MLNIMPDRTLQKAPLVTQLAAAPQPPPPAAHSAASVITQFLISAVLVLAVLPIARRSLRIAAWYWLLVAGPIAGMLLAWLLPHASWFDVIVSTIFLPILALHLRPKRRDSPYLSGARWADSDDLRPHQIPAWPAPSASIGAGVSWTTGRTRDFTPTAYGVAASDEGRHTLLVVPTGLGKGLWTVAQLLTWNGGAIVNDLKGDTYPQTAGWRQTIGPVYVLSAAAPVHRFDPTAAIDTEDDLRPLAHAICHDPEDRDPYWAQYASRILLVLMLAAKQSRQPVFRFVAQAVRSGAPRALALVSDIDAALADRIRPQDDSRTFASAWETLATRCESILSPNALATLSGTDFTAAHLLRQRATLYLQVPEARLGDLRPFLRLIWTSLIMQLVTATDRAGTTDRQPLLLVLDEAGRTPFAGLPDFLVTLRSRRISCAVLLQALSQLRAAYGEHAGTILGNCSVHVYARSEDLATQEYVSERLGLAEEILRTESSTRGSHGRSVTHSQLRRFRPLLTPQQVRTLQDHQVIAFLPVCPPAALARMDWRGHPHLVQRARLSPRTPAPLPVEAFLPSTSTEPRPAPAGYVDPD